MSKRVLYILIIIVVLSAIAALFATFFNKRWWIQRAVARWKLKSEVVDGSTWYWHTSGTMAGFRADSLLKEPLRRLREFYDTGNLKDPGATGDTIEQDAPDE